MHVDNQIVSGTTLQTNMAATRTVRTVLTSLSAHTFCASRKICFKQFERALVDTDAINHATNENKNFLLRPNQV